MNILFLMIPMALTLGIVFIAGFLWATKNGQMDDLDTPALRILNDEPIKEKYKPKGITNHDHRPKSN